MEADLILICFTALTRVPGAIKICFRKDSHVHHHHQHPQSSGPGRDRRLDGARETCWQQILIQILLNSFQ